MLIQRLPIGSPWIPLLLMALSIAVWAEMDLFAPALPELMAYFKTNEEVIQWTFSFNFFGFFVTSLFCGALADALGRRVVLLTGTALFVLGSVFSVTATQIEFFLLGRFIQGIGVSAPAVVVMAILTDLYQGAIFVRWLSITNCITTTTMALAPVAGAYLTKYYGWRSNFAVISAMAVLGFILAFLFVPETLPKENRKKFKVRFLITDYQRLLRSKKFLQPMLGLCFLVVPYFVFVGIISLLFMNELLIPMEEYVIYQGSIVAVFAFFSFLISVFGSRLNLDFWMRISVLICVLSATCLFFHGLFLEDNARNLTILMGFLASGVVIPCTFLYMRAVSVYPDLQASSAALFQSIRMLMLSVGTAIAGAMYNGFYMPIGLITGFCVLVGAILSVKELSRLASAGH